jgi:hypothetical protein
MNYKDEIEYIASQIIDDKVVVPIIGLEVIMHRKRDENGEIIGEETLQSFIVDQFVKNEKLDVNQNDNKLIEKMKKEGYHGLTLLYRHFKDKGNLPEIRDEFERQIEFFVTKKAKKDIFLHDKVKEFLLVSHPSLILTTCPFGIIEDELNVIGGDYGTINLLAGKAMEGIDPVLMIDEDGGKLGTQENCVVHLFGANIKASDCPWVCTERKLLLYLHILHNQRLVDFKLAKVLEGKKFIVIGCNLPEWLFQFLLYPLKKANEANGSYWLGKVEKTEDVARQEEILNTLNEHLSTYRCNVRSYKILDDITRTIKEGESHEKESANDNNEIYDFFISHRKEDISITKEIVDTLKRWNFKVWVDYEHASEIAGAQWQNIQDVIVRSKHIVPVITHNYIERYNSPNDKNEVGVKELTEIAFEFMFPKYDKKKKSGANVLRNGAESFLIPILKCDDKILASILAGVPIPGDPTCDLDIKTIKACWDKNLIPKQFSDLHFFFIGETEEIKISENYFKNKQLWRKLQAQGKTMKELNFSIQEILNNNTHE